MKNWFRKKLGSFLRLDRIEEKYKSLNNVILKNTRSINALQNLNSLAVDVHFREPSKIYVLSKHNGGQIREIPVNREMTIKELTNYKYKADPDSGLPTGVPEDKENHVIDALRYACESARKKKQTEKKTSKIQPIRNHW